MLDKALLVLDDLICSAKNYIAYDITLHLSKDLEF